MDNIAKISAPFSFEEAWRALPRNVQVMLSHLRREQR
jgi:hypothetical protein